MKIRSWKSTLHHLPPHGVAWRWSDVVGDGDGRVDPSAAYAVKPALDRVEDGHSVEYEVSEPLEEYLTGELGVELQGDGLPPEQSTLTESGPVPDADGDGLVKETSAGNRGEQATLGGGTATRSGDDDGGLTRSNPEADMLTGDWVTSNKEKAAEHPAQTALKAFEAGDRVIDKVVSPGGWVVNAAPPTAVGVRPAG